MDSGGYWDVALVAGVLESMAEEDRRILGRSLLFHPWAEYRKLEGKDADGANLRDVAERLDERAAGEMALLFDVSQDRLGLSLGI